MQHAQIDFPPFTYFNSTNVKAFIYYRHTLYRCSAIGLQVHKTHAYSKIIAFTHRQDRHAGRHVSLALAPFQLCSALSSSPPPQQCRCWRQRDQTHIYVLLSHFKTNYKRLSRNLILRLHTKHSLYTSHMQNDAKRTYVCVCVCSRLPPTTASRPTIAF